MNAIRMIIMGYLFIYVNCQSRRAEKHFGRTRRMIGGRKANLTEWLFTVYFSFLQPKAPFRICTGSLISKDWVLTAAHCVLDIKDDPRYLLVNARKISEQPKNERLFGVSKIVIPRMFIWKYNFLPPGVFSWDFDIALVRLNSSFPNDWPVAQLPANELNVTECKSAGWGSTKALRNFNDSRLMNYEISTILQNIDVPLIPLRKCHDYFSDHKTFAKFNFKVFCGGKLHAEEVVESGGCIGDSGSPLLCKSGKNGLVISGLLLGGHPLCKTGENYMIFTNISYYIKWIKKTTSL